MTNNEISIYNFKKNQVRMTQIEGEPWFVAMDVANILGYSDAQAMTKKLDIDEVQNRQIVGFGNRGVNTINEFGLYNCILGSTKPEAKEFKRWVTHEILPSIRKSGSYNMSNSTPLNLTGGTVSEIAPTKSLPEDIADLISAYVKHSVKKELTKLTPKIPKNLRNPVIETDRDLKSEIIKEFVRKYANFDTHKKMS